MHISCCHNLKNKDVVSRASKNFEDEVSFIRVKAIFVNHQDQWDLFSAFIAPHYESFLDLTEWYSNCVFVDACFGYSSIGSCFNDLIINGIAIKDELPAVKVDMNKPWTEYLIPEWKSDLQTPCRHYRNDLDTKHFNDFMLVAHGLPFYRSFFERSKDFIGFGKNEGQCINLVVPENRGRIHLEDFVANVWGVDGTCIVGENKVGKKVCEFFNRKDCPELSYEVDEDVELWLLSPENLVIDYVSSSDPFYRFSPDREKSEKEKIDEAVLGGESEHVEFKTFIDVNEGSNKNNEIEKAVCSLSNRNGGVLIIGVSDDGNVVGIEEKIRKIYRSNEADSLSKYKKDVRKRLAETLLNCECFDITSNEIAGHHVIAVWVSRSPHWNAVRANQIPYVRTGASDYNATPFVFDKIQIQRFLGERENLLGSTF